MIKSLICFFAATLFPIFAAAQPLRVSAIPDENPTELQRKFMPLARYLEATIGMPVKFIPVTDYAATVEGLAARKLDLVWFGGFTFVQARLRTGNAIPIVQRAEDEAFRSVFVTGDPSIRQLADFRGRTFAFGSPSSTSGHLMPRYFLMQQGIDPDQDFRRIAFSGAHDATAYQVAGRKVDGGALSISVWERLVQEGKMDPSKVRVVYTTPPYHDYNWTVRGDLDPALVAKLRQAFLSLDGSKPEQAAILKLQRATRYVPTDSENYKSIEQAARSAGLLK